MAVKKIGELLVESGLITETELKEAFEISKGKKGVRLGAILLEKGYATELDIAQTLAFQLNIPFVDISTVAIDPEVLKLISERIAQKYQLMPLYQEGSTLNVAMSDPLNLNAIDDLRFSIGLNIAPQAATSTDIEAAINRYYHLQEPIEDLLVDIEPHKHIEVVHEKDPMANISDQVKKSATPPIIKMVDAIIAHGVENRASDIHLEPQETNMILRVRIDGIMKEEMQMPKWVQGPVVSRIKLMAKLDITERRVAQDGRIKVRVGGRKLDLRVSTLPTQYGETVVMRVLDPNASIANLGKIGLSKNDLAVVIDLIERPQGVTLVTGPTGSGKTSTLYTMLDRIKKPSINIVTIEDPIEYELKKVNQVAVNEKAGLSFSYVLRSVLRQDPDVILVGEMRDAETAIIAMQASMTGHLVFSTLHTNDSVASITRLRNMGVPSYMISSSINGIIAQRLVRTICAHCSEPYQPTASEIEKAGREWLSRNKIFRGKGCTHCKGTGYSGRTGVFEVLPVTETIKGLIAADAPEKEIRKEAIAAGMVPLKEDGLKKVAAGITTLEELSRVIYLSRSDGSEMPECPSCHRTVVRGTPRCPHCGYAIEKTCPTCGHKL